MTHSDIADLIDKTPADIEAYEQGTRRITAASLMQLMCKLNVSLPLFFLDIEVGAGEALLYVDEPKPTAAPSVAEGLQLMKLFHSIEDPAKRASVLNFVSEVASTRH